MPRRKKIAEVDAAAIAELVSRGNGQEPEPDEATLAELLDQVDAVLARFVVFPTGDARSAVTLWAAHAHAIEAFESTPRLALLSPEKGSGKTRTLEVLELLVPNPMHAVNISASSLFRKVSEGKCTLLLDEADTYLSPRRAQDHEDLRALVNAGHRRGAVAYRCVVDKGVKVEEFPAFAPCAIAGIGDLPDTILDRSIVVAMKRRAPHEKVEPFRRRAAAATLLPLRDGLAAWASRARYALEDAWPVMPDGIVDRAADVWEPLVAIADEAGGDWPERARRAAVTLNAARQQRDPSLGVRLLADVRRVFDDTGADRISTDDLLAALHRLDEGPWGDLRGHALDARGLARRLRPYDVRPADHRFGDCIRKGYRRDDLHDAWSRYLPSPPQGSATRATSATSPAPHVAPVAHVALFSVGEAEADDEHDDAPSGFEDEVL
jgi:hypothetical protein